MRMSSIESGSKTPRWRQSVVSSLASILQLTIADIVIIGKERSVSRPHTLQVASYLYAEWIFPRDHVWSIQSKRAVTDQSNLRLQRNHAILLQMQQQFVPRHQNTLWCSTNYTAIKRTQKRLPNLLSLYERSCGSGSKRLVTLRRKLFQYAQRPRPHCSWWAMLHKTESTRDPPSTADK